MAILAGGSLVLRSGAGDRGLAIAVAEPPRDLDRDGDGVPDEIDRCLADAGLTPDGCPPRDSDGDGVIDRADTCPDRPGPRQNSGCPDTDGDGDGVVDRRDRCVDVPGLPRFSGCRPPDADGDGITDADDRCPDSAEVWNGRRDGDGCRDRGAARVVIQRPRAIVLPDSPFSKSGSLDRSGRRALRVAARYAAAVGAYRAIAVLERKAKKRRTDNPRRAARRVRALTRALRDMRPRLQVEMTEREGERDQLLITFE